MKRQLTDYTTKNAPVTGMSDDHFYGRQAAINVDIESAKRGAIAEVRFGVDSIITIIKKHQSNAGCGAQSAELNHSLSQLLR